MEENVKILQTQLKLTKDIADCDRMLMYNLRNIATNLVNILNSTRSAESTAENNIYCLDKKQREILEDLIYSVKSDDLVSERTDISYKDYARDKKVKKEILNLLG